MSYFQAEGQAFLSELDSQSENTDIQKFIEANKYKAIKALMSMNKNGDKKLTQDEVIADERNKKLIDAIGIIDTELADGVSMVDVFEKLDAYIGHKEKIIQETVKQEQVVKKELTSSGSFTTEKTAEKNTEVTHKFLGFETSKKERSDRLKYVNIVSLEDILRRDDLTSLYDTFYASLKTGGAIKDGEIKFGGSGDNNFKELLKKEGYQYKGNRLGYLEMQGVFLTVSDYIQTQRKIPQMSSQDQLKLLFDFDKDTELGTDKNFYVGEKQMDFHTNDALTSDGPDVLMENLGFGSMDEMSQKMQTNYFTARETFHRRLAIMLERGVKPAELTRVGGVNEANQRIYLEQQEFAAQIGDEFDTTDHPIITKLREKTQDQWEATKNTLSLEAVGMMVGSDNGIGASFDMSKLDLYFDSLQVGMVNGVPGIGISKKLLEKNGFNVGVSMVNIFIPTLGVSWVDEIDEEVSDLYQGDLKGQYQMSAYAAITLKGGFIGANFAKVDETTEKGIEHMVDKMGKLLEQAKEYIAKGKHFDASAFKDSPESEAMYTEMKMVYDTYGKQLAKQQQELFLNDMMQGYLSYYQTLRYQNAQGFKGTSIGGGIALIGGFLPIPYLTLGGESISTDWKGVFHSIERERDISRKTLTPEQAGLEVSEYNGNTVLKLENAQDMNISIEDGKQTQIERIGNTLYISADLRDISVDQHTDHGKLQNTLVIGAGETDQNGMYVPTYDYANDITTSIETKEPNTQEKLDIEAVGSTKDVRNTLGKLIQYDTLMHKETKGMLDLQRSIFSYQTGDPDKHGVKYNLEDAWDKFLFAFNIKGGQPKFENYVEQKGLTDEYQKLKSSIIGEETGNEKVLILQSIQNNFMEKEAFRDTGSDNKKEIAGGKTIAEYDTARNRGAYFDGLFAKDYPSLGDEIRTARKLWLNANGDKKEYNFKPESKGDIAFTGVQSGTNISGIMPYLGAYNIASTEGGVEYIDIGPLNRKQVQEVIMAIPERILKQYGKKLGMTDSQIPSIQKRLVEGYGKDINFDLAFTRMGECLNDAIVIQNLTFHQAGQSVPIGVSSTSEVYIPEHKVVDFGIVGADRESRRKQTSTNGNDVSTTTVTEGNGPSGNTGGQVTTGSGSTTTSTTGSGFNPNGN
ncbi:hypothetical protein MK079_01635 [Candidatus Gracilibacteria bacterium]|nr:hypothetical protein [Candidatus Gracilibacteria bacterium]